MAAELFAKDKFVQIQNVVKDERLFAALVNEAQTLKKYSEYFKVSGHSQYRHCKPSVFSRIDGDWLLPKFYKSPELRQLVESVVGKKLFVLPLDDSDRFEINCKINYYKYLDNGRPVTSSLDFHYDRTDQVNGKTFVVVLTLVNDLDSSVMNLTSYKYGESEPESIHCGANSVTIHDADMILHKVENVVVNPDDYASDQSLERIVFVMKFTDDPTPQNFLRSSANKIILAIKMIVSYCQLYPSLAFLVTLICTLIVVIFLKIQYRRHHDPPNTHRR